MKPNRLIAIALLSLLPPVFSAETQPGIVKAEFIYEAAPFPSAAHKL